MAHCDSVEFAVETAKSLNEPLPTPTQNLDQRALDYWPAVIGAKRRNAWTDVDIALATTLARDLGAIEQLSEDLAHEGHVLTDARGKRYANPAANLLDQTTRRAANTARAIQIHAIATTGRVQDGAKKNEAAREIAAQVSAASDLIARA